MKAYKVTGKLGDICSFVGGNEVKKGDMVYFHSESGMKQERVAKPQGEDHMSIEGMKQALEAMEYADACLKKQLTTKTKHEYAQDLLMDAGIALRQALSKAQLSVNENSHAIKQAQNQKPVAEIREDMKGGGYIEWLDDTYFVPGTKFYTQPQREWVGLTDAEIEEFDYYARDLVMDIEKALKEKNNVA